MKKPIIIASTSIVVSLLVLLTGIFFWKNLRGIWPAIRPPSGDIVSDLQTPAPTDLVQEPKNNTSFPLKLPQGFSISVFAKDLPGARVMEFDTFDNLWVTQTSKGTVSLLEIKDNKVNHQSVVLKNLKNPHGLAFDPNNETLLYVAEENKISKISTYSEGQLDKIIDLPSGTGHFTRTIGFGPDSRLYVSIGSSCNVCNEKDDRRAKIFSLNSDGSDFVEFARGLRNSVFFTWSPLDGKMWATDMGRDLLGDDTPPDEINIIQAGGNYGWPNCYGKNIHDTNFDHNTYIRNPCMEPFEKPSVVDLQAHSAPLGLAFIPENSNWPKEYWNNLIVAFHGSWNRTVPTGYKLVRIKLDKSGNYLGTEDFITGWLASSGALGRPVDVKFHNDILYVSDDKAGLIYEVYYNK